MVRLSQRDKRWANNEVGESGLTIGEIGCTLTAICMGHSRFYRKTYIKPHEAAKEWKFRKTDGKIYWTTSPFTGMKFVKRVYGCNIQELKDWTAPDRFAIVELDNYHWCTVAHYHPWGLVLHDPINSNVLWYWKRKYKAITGYALFEKI